MLNYNYLLEIFPATSAMNEDISGKQNPEEKLLEINLRWRNFSKALLVVSRNFISAVKKYDSIHNI
jgi:hypothetical protein